MKTFFKNENERNLWIRLNAERIQGYNNIIEKYLEIKSNEIISEVTSDNMGDMNKPYSYMWISKNQLEYDENNKDAPRFSLEQLLILTPKELFVLVQEKNSNYFK
jgi:hypothetical protein